MVRSGLHHLFPKLVDPDPNLLIGLPHYTLADVYDMATKQGILAKHREINLRTRQDFFERQTGMVKENKKNWVVTFGMFAAIAVTVPVAILFGMQRGQSIG